MPLSSWRSAPRSWCWRRYTRSETLLLIEITVSLACVQSVFVNTYSLTNDLLHAGKSIGTAVGWIQLGGNIFGLVAPIATGYIVAATGRFTSAFLLAGASADHRRRSLP